MGKEDLISKKENNPQAHNCCGCYKHITCFGVAEVAGLFEDMSGRQGVLHKQGSVGHHHLWLRLQELCPLGDDRVTHPTEADLKDKKHIHPSSNPHSQCTETGPQTNAGPPS